MYMDVLKVKLVANKVGIFFQMTNQLLTQSSITKKYTLHLSTLANADTFNVCIRHTETL